MKIQFYIFIVVAFVMFSSCSMHDPYGDIMSPGSALPTVSWELGSTVANAGDSVSFKGKYYTDKEHMPERSEVWASIVRTQSASASNKLTPTLGYTQTVGGTDTVRMMQKLSSYPHSMAVFDGYEFILNAKFPTSQTLKSLTWANIGTWDQEKFDSYYPENFQSEFVEKVVDYLTKDSLYYSDLRYVYVNYNFTLGQIQNVIDRFPNLNQNGELDVLLSEDSETKSQVWYTQIYKTDDASGELVENIVGYYYITVENGVVVYHEIGKDEQGPDGIKLYPVYESSPWVFCRYDDNTGGPITAVRSEYMPFFKELVSLIPFTDWIYNSTDKVYSVSFSRSYTMNVMYKVIDTEGNVGYTTDKMEISLN